jgi:hypothetical protein
MADYVPRTRFHRQADVDSCLSAVENRLRFLEDLFGVLLEVRHRYIDVDFGADAYAALTEFCNVAGNDLANLQKGLPFEMISFRLANLAPRKPRAIREADLQPKGRARRRRKGGRGHAARAASQPPSAKRRSFR